MPNMTFWKNLGRTMEKANKMIPKECRIGDTCFTSLGTIVGNLYTRHLKNLNNVHKESKDLLSAIIILGIYVNGGGTVFYDGENMNDIGKRAHLLNHSHGRCVIGSFDIFFHEGSIRTGNKAFLSFILTNKDFFTLCIMVQDFMKNIYH